MKIHSIPDKFEVTWNNEVKAIIDTVIDYSMSLEEFEKAVMHKGLDHAKANKGVAWIVDSSNATNVFSQEIQLLIKNEVFPAFSRNGIKYFLTITSKLSSLTKVNIKHFSAKTDQYGIKHIQVNSVEDAITWLSENA
ncbi:MAG: hypothetical protein HQL32_13240 [Planctomycetes bacterium]|nr:hypothetical protein [Planctomycetota bacterium]